MAPNATVTACPFYDADKQLYALTNFAALPVTIGGIQYPTTEHYFQAQKFAGPPDQRQAFLDTVKQKGNRPSNALDVARDWTDQHWKQAQWQTWNQQKQNVMRTALREKMEQYPALKEILRNTGNSCLVEDTASRDEKVWGWGAGGNGTNYLGILWMELRNELHQQSGRHDLIVDPNQLYSRLQTERQNAGHHATSAGLEQWGRPSPISVSPAPKPQYAAAAPAPKPQYAAAPAPKQAPPSFASPAPPVSSSSASAGNIQQRLGGFTSDHGWQTIEATDRAPNGPSTTLRGFTWNLLNKGHEKGKGAYSNNPFDIQETNADYVARKQAQFNEIIQVIQERKGKNEPLDFLLLQEVNAFLSLELDGMPGKKAHPPKFPNAVPPVPAIPGLKAVVDQFKSDLQREGYAIEMTTRESGCKPMVTLYNTNTLRRNGPVEGFVKEAHSNKNTAFSVPFIHHATGQAVEVTNLHLPYGQDTTHDLLAHQFEKTRQGVFSVMGGDTNHPPNHELQGQIGNFNYITNIGADANGTVTGYDDREKGYKKHYDGFFVAPGGHTHRAVATETEGIHFDFRNGQAVAKRYDPAIEYPNHRQHAGAIAGIPWIRQRNIELLHPYAQDPQVQANLGAYIQQKKIPQAPNPAAAVPQQPHVVQKTPHGPPPPVRPFQQSAPSSEPASVTRIKAATGASEISLIPDKGRPNQQMVRLQFVNESAAAQFAAKHGNAPRGGSGVVLLGEDRAKNVFNALKIPTHGRAQHSMLEALQFDLSKSPQASHTSAAVSAAVPPPHVVQKTPHGPPSPVRPFQQPAPPSEPASVTRIKAATGASEVSLIPDKGRPNQQMVRLQFANESAAAQFAAKHGNAPRGGSGVVLLGEDRAKNVFNALKIPTHGRAAQYPMLEALKFDLKKSPQASPQPPILLSFSRQKPPPAQPLSPGKKPEGPK